MIKVSDLFDVKYGVNLELNALRLDPNGINFVSRTAKNNGVAARVELISAVIPLPAGTITVAGGGSVMESFLQPEPYYSGRDLYSLTAKIPMSDAQKLYYCLCLRANHYRYNYGRQANRTLSDILLPSPENIPGWIYSVSLSDLDNKDASVVSGVTPYLEVNAWQPFRLSHLFSLQKGKRLTKANMIAGLLPFIGAIDGNNGISAAIAAEPHHPGNTLTVSYNGSVGEAFYQPNPYRCSDDVNVLYPNFPMTPAIGLFIATIIRQEKYRFNYGRKWHLERMEQSEIRLPVDAEGNPDWTFMENYIKTLPFSSQV